jgi:hypothetical protein
MYNFRIAKFLVSLHPGLGDSSDIDNPDARSPSNHQPLLVRLPSERSIALILFIVTHRPSIHPFHPRPINSRHFLLNRFRPVYGADSLPGPHPFSGRNTGGPQRLRFFRHKHVRTHYLDSMFGAPCDETRRFLTPSYRADLTLPTM